HRYRQIGNAVPVLLGEAVGAAVIRALEAPRRLKPDANTERFHQLLTDWREEADLWSPPWRRHQDPWLVLAAELLLTRARRQDAEELFERLRELAPTPAALLAHE